MNGERMHPLTEYGVAVMTKLIQLNHNATWLCQEVSTKGNCYMDTQYLNKILTGKIPGAKKVELINEVLDEEEAKQNAVNRVGEED